jgi:hypothetical protein
MMLLPEIKRRNRDAGFHFFDRDALRFFGSKILSYTWARKDGTTFFVTSERRPASDDPRRYTVRVFNPKTNTVSTHGRFLQYETRGAAFIAARDASLEVPA